MIKTINPKNKSLIKTYTPLDDDKMLAKIKKAHDTYMSWRETTFEHRKNKMLKAAQTLENKKQEFAQLMTDEMGKPIKESISEIEKCVWVCEYYAKEAEGFLEAKNVDTDYNKSLIHYAPMGVIFAIMPWNFPFWQVFRFAVPTLMAGNTALLKHAKNVSGSSLAIQSVFEEAGFPPGCFTSLLIDHNQSNQLIEHSFVKAVTLTGSNKAGITIAEQAGKNLKKTVLELGGSDPYLILEDADVNEAAKLCAQSRLLNSGQSCIAAKRFIVVKSQKENFQTALVKVMESYVVGDPSNKNSQIGPMAREDLKEILIKQIKESISKGAQCILGENGNAPSDDNFVSPTILTDVKPGMPAFDDELFGPVAAIITAEDTDHAIELANQSQFGLGSAIFSQDKELALDIALHKLQAGSCFINDFVKSDPRLPFGGIKNSGYGRELGEEGIKAFVNIKTIALAN